MRKLMLYVLAAGSLFLSHLSMAATIDTNDFYLGGGISKDEYRNINETSFIVFAGLPLDIEFYDFHASAEAGIWFNDITEVLDFSGFAAREIQDKFYVTGRIGYIVATESGVDSEIQFGPGLQYDLDKSFSARGELLFAGDIDSLKFSLVYKR